MSSRPKIAFISQRCGTEIVGGAENLCLNLAKNLSDYFDIDILTTCALDYMTWENHYESGNTRIFNFNILRFKTDFQRNVDAFNKLSEKVLLSSPNRDEEYDWIKSQGPYSSTLISYIQQHKNDYSLFVFFTYLYGTTFFSLLDVSEKSVLIPLAHNELPLKLKIYDNVFLNANSFVFQTDEEKKLVLDRFNLKNIHSTIIGPGIDSINDDDNSEFKNKYNFPYILYVGRVDESKGCNILYSYFKQFKAQFPSDLKLIFAGPKIQEFENNTDVIYLGKVDDSEKDYLLNNTLIFVMPSFFESFSIATMEAWLAKKPVLVNEQCDVLKGHCEKSNGGLYFEDYESFAACLNLLLSDSKLRQAMGSNGYEYVQNNYTWKNVVNNYCNFLQSCILKC